MHSKRTSNTGPEKFGVSAPRHLVLEFDAARLRHRPDLDSRSAAVREAMEEWVERHRENAVVNEYIENARAA